MKINQETIRHAVRWLAPTSTSLKEAVNHLCVKRRDGSRWDSICLDGREATPGEPDFWVRFHLFHLTSMRHFRVCHVHEGMWEILIGSGGAFDAKMLETIIPRYAGIDLKKMRSTYLTFIRLGRYSSDNPNDLGEIGFRFGWRTHAGPPGYYLEAYCSNPRSNATARYAFISNVIRHLDLGDIIQVEGDEREFTLAVAPGWSLYEIERRLDKRNPSYFPIGPFPSFEDVWQRTERFRASSLGKEIDRLCVNLCATPDVYETVYEQLNGLADDWHVSFYGSYADGIDPYTADASQSPDGRFPVFMWIPEREEGNVFYQANILPTPEGRFLEVHSNCGDMKKLLKEAKTAIGMEFTPVEQ